MRNSVAARIIDRLEDFAQALHNQETISEKFTCRRVVLNLEPTPYKAADVKQTRQSLNVSQSIFAQFLGVSVKTVRSWEQGVTTPNDMACRFMDEIKAEPKFWRKRLMASFVEKEKTPRRAALTGPRRPNGRRR